MSFINSQLTNKYFPYIAHRPIFCLFLTNNDLFDLTGFSSGYDSNSDTNLKSNRRKNLLQWSPWRSNDDSDSDSEISDVDSCISESESEDEEGAWKQRGAWLNEEAWSDSSDSESEDDADSVKYVNAEAVSEALTVVMDMPDLCDVTFLVGSTLTPVHGVKSIMSTRSRYVHFFHYRFILYQFQN